MNHWNRIWALLACFFVLLEACNKQKNVAEVDGKEITADEFRDRYGAYIQNQASTRDNILLRQQIVNNMINEQLIYEDSHMRGFDSDSLYQERMEESRDQALLDRYAKSISIDTVRVTDQELWNEFRAFNSKAKVRYLYARTETEALELKAKLERGATFEELARDVFSDPGLANNGGDLGYFGWGEMEPALEEAAFTLPIGNLSDPVRLRIGYAIVQVEDRLELPLASEFDFAKNREKLEQAIFDRKVVRVIGDAAHRIEKELSPQFNEEAVKLIFDAWRYVFKDEAPPSPKESQIPFENASSLRLVTFQGTTWTVGDFLKRVQRTTRKQRRRIKSLDDVKATAIGLAVREMLLTRAYQKGFGNDSDVLAQIDKARQRYLLKRWASAVQDTVGQSGWNDDSLRAQYGKDKEQYYKPPEVNVAEILVRSEGQADSLRRRLRRGADFSELARKNSIRLWAAKNGGELGYGTKSNYGSLGGKIFAARIGDIIGPEAVDPYYGIFKIIGKRDGRQKSFEESKDDIAKQLAFSKKQEVFKEFIEKLRGRAKISIHDDILANVKLNS